MLSKNVESKTDEVKTTNSRAARMARSSPAAAGVAAVSTLDVDAAVIVVELGTPIQGGGQVDLSSAAFAPPETFGITLGAGKAGVSGGSMYGNGSSFVTSNLFGTNELIGPATSGWLSGGFLGSWQSSSTAFVGFRLPTKSDFIYGYLQLDFGSSPGDMTLQYWGYESVVNTGVMTPSGSSSVPDAGPGFVGIALLGAGAAGMRLLRKLRANK